jgi:hypothetical protein
VQKTQTYNIVVAASELLSIQITNPPTTKDYIEGQTFNPTGLEVWARYSNPSDDEKITAYTLSPTGALTMDTTSITVEYGGKSDVITGISVVPRELDSIRVKAGTGPAKTSYESGESFDPTGMVIEAVFNGGAWIRELASNEWTHSPTDALNSSITQITVSFTDGVLRTVDIDITVTTSSFVVTVVGGSGSGTVAGGTMIFIQYQEQDGKQFVMWRKGGDEYTVLRNFTYIVDGDLTFTATTKDIPTGGGGNEDDEYTLHGNIGNGSEYLKNHEFFPNDYPSGLSGIITGYDALYIGYVNWNDKYVAFAVYGDDFIFEAYLPAGERRAAVFIIIKGTIADGKAIIGQGAIFAGGSEIPFNLTDFNRQLSFLTITDDFVALFGEFLFMAYNTEAGQIAPTLLLVKMVDNIVLLVGDEVYDLLEYIGLVLITVEDFDTFEDEDEGEEMFFVLVGGGKVLVARMPNPELLDIAGFDSSSAEKRVITLTYDENPLLSAQVEVEFAAEKPIGRVEFRVYGKVYFEMGQEPNADNFGSLELRVYYAAGNSSTIKVLPSMITGLNLAIPGTRTATVHFMGEEFEFEYTVNIPYNQNDPHGSLYISLDGNVIRGWFTIPVPGDDDIHVDEATLQEALGNSTLVLGSYDLIIGYSQYVEVTYDGRTFYLSLRVFDAGNIQLTGLLHGSFFGFAQEGSNLLLLGDLTMSFDNNTSIWLNGGVLASTPLAPYATVDLVSGKVRIFTVNGFEYFDIITEFATANLGSNAADGKGYFEFIPDTEGEYQFRTEAVSNGHFTVAIFNSDFEVVYTQWSDDIDITYNMQGGMTYYIVASFQPQPDHGGGDDPKDPGGGVRPLGDGIGIQPPSQPPMLNAEFTLHIEKVEP